MALSKLFVFDCGSPTAPEPIASFAIDTHGDGRLRYLPPSPGKTEVFSIHPPSLVPDKGEVQVPLHFDGTYFLSDSSPGSWGSRVIASLHRQAKEPLPTNAFEWLIQSKNFGSGRLAFSADIDDVPEPAVVTMTPRDITSKLLDALYSSIDASDTFFDAQTLRILRPGCDLGGVRPKTLVSHEGREHIVKFGLPNDSFDVPLAEYATLRLAHLAGVSVPSFELIAVGSRTALLLERFDRTETGGRVHYLSAYSLLNPRSIQANGSEYKGKFSYGGIAEAMQTFAGSTPAQGHELFRRMILNIMVGNIDDHLRNHALLMREPGLFELSPAYDLCPHLEAPFRPQSIGVGEFGPAGTVENALSQCTRFLLTRTQATRLVSEVKDVVSTWRQVFVEAGATRADLRQISPSFGVAEQADSVGVNLALNS